MRRGSEPTLGVRGLRPVVAGLRALGHDPTPILASVGLDEALLADPDGRVPAAAVMQMLVEGAAATGDTDLGLHLAEAASMADFDVHAYATQSSPTLGAAYERLCRYQRLIHNTSSVHLDVDGERAILRHTLPGGFAIPRHSAEFVVAAWLRLGRVATGIDWAPDEVHFAHPRPEDVRELERYFRCPLLFSAGENSMAFPAAMLQQPCLEADPGLLDVLERHADALLEQIPRTNSLSERVLATLPGALRHGDARAAAVAASLKMSVRTLHRCLADEHTSFRDILDRFRHEEAVRGLADARLGIAEIAFDLGFSELSSFYRAFRRWTGATPADYRARRFL